MRKVLLSALSALLMGAATAQPVIDTVTLGAGYANQSFYRLSDGNNTSVDKSSYELAFDVSGAFSTSIHLNSSSTAGLWLYPNGDVTAWNNFDTTGYSTWTAKTDDPQYWGAGAFDITDGSDPFDVGWGLYDVTTHIITGDSLYLIRTANGDFKKLQIIDFSAGAYHFRYADVDGSNEVSGAIAKADYAGKQYAYYSIANEQALDLEPVGGWDLLFGQYIAFLPTPYLVSGIFSSPTSNTSQADGVVQTTYEDFSAGNFVEDRDVIGYDWKSFGGQGFEVDDQVVFFIETVDGSVWKLYPIEFSGSSLGQFVFSKEQLSTAALFEAPANTNVWYPNPTSGVLHLKTAGAKDLEILVYDLGGRLVMSTHTQEALTEGLSLAHLKEGVYWVQVGTDIQRIQLTK